MLKYSSLVFLVAVTLFWSQVNAAPHPQAKAKSGHYFISRSQSRGMVKREAKSGHVIISLNHPRNMVKREVDDDDSRESRSKFIKNLLVGLLVLSTETPAEALTLSEKYKQALDGHWDSLDDFGDYVVKTYEDVTGRDLNDLAMSESSEESSEEV